MGVIEINIKDKIALCQMNRTPVNAIDTTMLQEMEQVLDSLEKDPNVSAIVLTGNERAFSVGLDLKIIPTLEKEGQKALISALNKTIARFYSFPLPIIAALNGHAIAGGLIVALACDYRISTEDLESKVGLTEVRVGVPFPISALLVIQAELPPQTARKLMLVGRNINPRQALDFGIVDEITTPENVLPRAIELAKDMANSPKNIYGKIKKQLRAKTIHRMEENLKSKEDPLLKEWLDQESIDASAAVLAKKRET